MEARKLAARAPQRPQRRRIARCRKGPWFLGLVGYLVAGAVRAELAPATNNRSLADVIQAALTSNADLGLAAADVAVSKAALEVAAEPFDGALTAGLTGNRVHSFNPSGGDLPVVRATSGNATLALSRRFRNGLTIGPDLTASTTRYRADGMTAGDVTEVSARFRIVLPLLQDRGGAVVAAAEVAAAADHLATVMDLQQAEMALVAQVARAYWAHAAAERRWDVLLASEERAKRTVAETAALVKADERTGADLIQAKGYESSHRTTRIKAEQDLLVARQGLATLMGGHWEAALTGFRATTPLPVKTPGGPAADRPLPWMDRAFEQRPDVAAIDCRLRAANTRLAATKSAVSARLDLSLTTGYAAQTSGVAAFGDVPGRVPGMDAMVGLSYQAPLGQSGARGKVAHALGGVRRLEVARGELLRRLQLDLATAYEQVRIATRGMAEASEAVRLMERTVESERRKFQLGSSTLFAVNQAEESLTGALLGSIEETRSYATAIAMLRLEAGALGGSPAEVAVQLTGLE